MPRYVYDSNNSGGNWWLGDSEWNALEAAGWDVHWYKDRDTTIFRTDANGRWLGALAGSASKEFPSLEEAINEFEDITGESVDEVGCYCCGPPHSIREEW